MKLKTTLTYNYLVDYLKDKLSNQERHLVEKKLMQDVFEEEAFDGLSSISTKELESDILELQHKISSYSKEKKTISYLTVIKIAASIVVLIGISLAVRMSYKNKSILTETKQIAQSQQVKTDIPNAMTSSESMSKSKEITAPNSKEENPASPKKVAPEKQIEQIEEVLSTEALSVEADVSEDVSESMNEVNSKEPYIPTDISEKEIYKAEEKASGSLKGVIAGTVIPETNFSNQPFKGLVTDKRGQPLPGVAIMEKGTSNAAISDMNGKYEIKLNNPESTLEFKSIGYITEELPADDIKNGKTSLAEDQLALDEVVVISYGTQKKSDITGAVSTITMEDSENNADVTTFRPTPPTGNIYSYRKYIYKSLNYSLFDDLTEKQKIDVEFTVYKDGSVGKIIFREPADPRICKEIKRVILSSDKWKPGLMNETVIDMKVKLTLNIDPLEYKK